LRCRFPKEKEDLKVAAEMKKDAPRCSEDGETGYPKNKELGKERAGLVARGLCG
jgi:hypothetical protein